MEKTSHKVKISPGEFKVIISKKLLVNNQAVTSMRNLTTTLARGMHLTHQPAKTDLTHPNLLGWVGF